MFEIEEFTKLNKIIKSNSLKENEGRIIIPFSGGVDSTFLAFQFLHNLKDTNKEIYLVSINSYFIFENQKENEKKAREKILNYFEDNGFEFNYIEFDNKYNNPYGDKVLNGKHSVSRQSFIWLINLAMRLDDNDSIFFGYVSDDTFWKDNQKDKFDKLLLSYKNIFELSNVTTHFPLKNWSKKEIIDYLYDTGLLNKVWFCTDIDIDTEYNNSCGECYSCRVYNNALMELYVDGNEWVYKYMSENYKSKVIKN